MIRILVVDDEHEKIRVISGVVSEVVSMEVGEVVYAGNAVDAKRLIKENRFDLVVLDINLPRRADMAVEVDGGLDVIRFIKNNNKAKQPAYLFGLTAHDDAESAASEEFSSPLWKLVRFSHADISWKVNLREALEYIVGKNRPPYFNDGFNYHTDVAIFTAIDEELESILSLDCSWQEERVPHDSSLYYRGSIPGEDKVISVVVTVAPRMGMPCAAVSATKLIHNFRPRVLAISGICAGVRGKSNLGDVLVADPCFDWGSGKWIFDKESQRPCFQPAHYQWRLNESIRSAMKTMSKDKELLFDIRNSYFGKRPSSDLSVFVDAVASGASVLQASLLVDDVKGQHKNLVGIEMESYAVFSAAELAPEPRPLCVSVKSVCDFGDEEKNDDFHGYAAHTSANFIFNYILRYLADNRC